MVSLERWTFRTADVSIATNESYRRIAIERGGMDPRRYSSCAAGRHRAAARCAADAGSWRGAAYLVGYVGVMGQQEGIDLVLRRRAHDPRPGADDVHFGIVGDGPELAELPKRCGGARGRDYVTFTGRVPDAELLAMLNTATSA